MGITNKILKVSKNFEDKETVEVDFLIDSGAVYSLIPKEILKKLKIKAHKEKDFSLADGTIIKRKIGGAFFEFENENGYAPVIFGEKGDEPLLGATTLESLGLILNPFKRELYPMRLIMI